MRQDSASGLSYALPPRAGRGRTRFVKACDLNLHADAFPAFQVWLDIGFWKANPFAVIEVLKDKEGRLLCFSGFSARSALVDLDSEGLAFVWRPHSLADDMIRRAAWSEVLNLPLRVRPLKAARWVKALRRSMPKDLAKQVFGARGLTDSAAARHLNIGRGSLARHLREAQN